MREDLRSEESAIIKDKNAYNKEIKTVPKPEENIGIENKSVIDRVIDSTNDMVHTTVDLATFNSFNQVATSRNQLYNVLDLMAQDSIITAILETYAEDATETNEEGKIIWAKSKDPSVEKFVNYLIKIMQFDKHAYAWVYSLILYGDLYLQLYKKSDYDNDIFKKKEETVKDKLDNKNTLNEDLKIYKYASSDHYVDYLEAIENPAQMFELTRFGKTSGFIETENIPTAINTNQQNINGLNGFVNMYQYKASSNDIKLYDNDKFVHASLETGANRTSEEVTLFRDDKDKDGVKYKVRKGQSLLYNAFKI